MLVDQVFSPAVLELDCEKTCDMIAERIREIVHKRLRKKGILVAFSGGIDSSVVGALCVKALGADRVFGILMPEKDSSPDTLRLSQMIVEHLGVRFECRDITSTLMAVGCYQSRDDAIRSVIGEYGAGYTCKIVLPSVLEKQRFNLFSVVVSSPDGKEIQARLPLAAYQQIVAASNYKQRVRKMLEYYYADCFNYAVSGTPNRLEYDQGFFVKLGDGAADIKPIAHLYKTQVYQLANYLGIPKEIVERPPTTDTYSMPQSQEEFYFSVPYDIMDLCLYGKNHEVSAAEVGQTVDLTTEQVERIYRDIEAKRRATQYQHAIPILIEAVEELK